MARYAVTGAAGFIGSALVRRLKNEGHFVRAIDFRVPGGRAELTQVADESDWDCDLRSQKEAIQALYGCERAFHLAADHGGAGYFHSAADGPAARNNMRIDLNMIRAGEVVGIERMFYASSFCAYPISEQGFGAEGLHEGLLHEGTPEQLYGAEKRFALELFEDTDFARCGVFATIYGPHQEASGIRAKFPTAITKRIIEAVDGDPIELWGDGSQVRTFLFIPDALDRIIAVMEKDDYPGPVNIASDQAVSVQTCAEWVCRLADKEPIFDHRMDMPTGVDERTPDNTFASEAYGFSDQISWTVGFEALYEHMAANLAKTPQA